MTTRLTGGCMCGAIRYECYAASAQPWDYMNPELPKFPKFPPM